jgi:hypothetical protein
MAANFSSTALGVNSGASARMRIPVNLISQSGAN